MANTNLEARKIVVDQVVQALDHLNKHFKEAAAKTLSTTISVEYISRAIEVYKENYTREALKEDDTQELKPEA